MALGFHSRGRGFWTFSGRVSYASTEETEIVGKLTSLFGGGEFTILAEFVTQVRLFLIGVVSGRAGFVRMELFLLQFVLIVLVQ